MTRAALLLALLGIAGAAVADDAWYRREAGSASILHAGTEVPPRIPTPARSESPP